MDFSGLLDVYLSVKSNYLLYLCTKKQHTMKKILILLLFTTTMSNYSCFARKQIIAMGEHFELANDERDPISKVPVKPIYIVQNDHVFIFNTNYKGCIIEIIAKGTILYKTIVEADNCIYLPMTFEGEYELHLFAKNKIYCAYIIL